MPLKTVKKFGEWIGKQVDGFIGGVMQLAATSPKSWIPEGLWSTMVWFGKSLTWALGTSTAIKQITASFALVVFSLLTSWVTLGATLFLVGVFVVTMGIGFVRLIPAVDEAFVAFRETVVP